MSECTSSVFRGDVDAYVGLQVEEVVVLDRTEGLVVRSGWPVSIRLGCAGVLQDDVVVRSVTGVLRCQSE